MVQRIVLSLVAFLAPVSLYTGAASAQNEGDSTVLIVEVNNRQRQVTEGDSNTLFTLKLPDGAACPGDSANDNWRINSFIMPEKNNPGELRFGEIGPEGPQTDAKWAIYDAETVPINMELTQRNAGPGEPGLIRDIEPLSFAVFRPEYLPNGRYRIGIACTPPPDWKAERYWDTLVDVREAPAVEPGGLRWTVVDQDNGTEPGGSAGVASAWIAGLVMAAAASTWMLIRRQRAPRQTFTSRSKT